MAHNLLRNLLNRLRWVPGAAGGELVLEVRVRVDGDERLEEIAFNEVSAVLPAGVTLADGTFLPYHRIALVRDGAKLLWRARRRAEDGT